MRWVLQFSLKQKPVFYSYSNLKRSHAIYFCLQINVKIGLDVWLTVHLSITLV
jgi:hypothetical protein